MSDLEEIRKEIDSYKSAEQKRKSLKKEKQISAMVVCSEIVGAVVIAFALGVFLDSFFETDFLFKAILIILAFMSSLYTLYKMTK